MRIRELFVADVTRDIPPVVYFHEQSPARLASEVSEYIITGGYPEGDPRARRVRSGIHEEFVHLLRGLLQELQKKGGPELPASWISGFYGSGKSSFAKLLGLALDGVELPDGTALSTALLRRDDSPRAHELVEAWEALRARIHPIAVVFDIGGVARDNEHIHSAALRQVQTRLGYCGKSNLVAEHELKLERDGLWPAFLTAAERTLGRPWAEAKEEELAEDHFSHVLHVLEPERYKDPTSWIDSRAGSRTGAGTSVREVVESIDAMLSLRAEGRTLFLVVDEVSQYVHQDEGRMLKLQTFVSELGQKLKGVVWLFATGQQKLEDQSEANNIGKLKDRFPPSLRVHLATTNIRDVVHKRLLKKAPEKEPLLRELFQKHRGELKLYGYACEELTEEDFLEVYPLLPGHVELLARITTSLRTRSSRVQGDDHAIRGLLQLLGELFRQQNLADREVGHLVTLDAIFEVQHSALDADVQTTLARIFNHPEVREHPLAQRVARAVALLELIQEQLPTTPALVAQCLYARLGDANPLGPVTEVLEKLRALNLLSYSEKHGYKIQSSAGQEWQREREDLGITPEQLSGIIRDKLKELLGMPERPRYKGRPFPYAAWYSDGQQAHDERVVDPHDDSTVAFDFRFLTRKEERTSNAWVQRSDQEPLRDRILWLAGEPGPVQGIAREYGKSARMVERYESRRESLTRDKQRLLIEEQTRLEELEGKVKAAVAEAFLEGTLYFRGRPMRPGELGGAFGTVLHGVATRVLPELYPHFTEVAVTETELQQLLEPTLSGPSTKFLEGGLGLLSLDAGRYVATCSGAEPSRLLQFIESGGASGATLLSKFGKPPYGYPTDVVRACLAGLLRAGKIRIRPEQGPEITSVRDPGTRDLFRRERDLRRADFFPARDSQLTARDRISICGFFKKHLGLDLERENEAIADAVDQQFPGQRERLRELEALFDRLPGRPPLPVALQKLGRALEDCRRSRQIEGIVLGVKKNLDALADGLEQLALLQSELTEAAIHAVREAARVRDTELAQLRQAESLGGLEEDAAALARHLEAERPWREVGGLEPVLERLRERYEETRRNLLNQQNAEVEAARRRVKKRAGFERLDADQAHRVLRPLAEALTDTHEKAVAPSLTELRDRFPARRERAEEEANDRLDELLEEVQDPVVKVEAHLRGREVASREQLRALFTELEERIGPHLDQGKRVRLT
ncbi:MAG TPA: BREX system P-loop protein BrxC [Myxococcaceae bacterium]|nr:BREX system P-loop protein BrxC [Myxococcaceae bacterium]